MSQKPCRSVQVVTFSPRLSSQSSTRPLNCLKRSFISSLAWPTAVRIRSLTVTESQRRWVKTAQLTTRVWGTSGLHSLSSGMVSSSTLDSQRRQRSVSLSVSLDISDLNEPETKWCFNSPSFKVRKKRAVNFKVPLPEVRHVVLWLMRAGWGRSDAQRRAAGRLGRSGLSRLSWRFITEHWCW